MRSQVNQGGECRTAAAILTTLPPSAAAAGADAVPVLVEKLAIEGTRLHAVRAIGVVARTPVAMADAVPAALLAMQSLLRKDSRALRNETLATGAALLEVYGADLAGEGPLLEGVLSEAVALVQEVDLMLAAAALDLCATALKVCLDRCLGVECDWPRASRNDGTALVSCVCGMQAVPGAGELAATTAFVRAAVALAGSAALSAGARASLSAFFATAQSSAIPQLSFESLRGELTAVGSTAPRPVQRGIAEAVTAMCEGSAERVASTVNSCVVTMGDSNRVRASSRDRVRASRSLCACLECAHAAPCVLAWHSSS